MQNWQPTHEQKRQYERDGYLILRGVIPHDAAMEMRGVIKNIILSPEPATKADADPMDPMGDSPMARAARFRKLARVGLDSPLLWDYLYTGETVLPVVRYFLGDDLLLKFTSCFLKPARTGSATPWHQDNGLWRDGETGPFNLWMALDAATKANGCLQFIPGSHQTEIVPHVLYEDSVHGELPRERVREMIQKNGLHHIELEPGDAVCWHSSLWHYSPPNTSEQGRIGVAGVWTNPQTAATNVRFKQYHWVMKRGERRHRFPPEPYVVAGEPVKHEPWPKAA
jgi:hypothetical protein